MNLLSLETLPLITKPHLDGSTWSPVPINTDFCSMLLAQLTHHLKSKQIDKGLDCSRSRVSGCWRLGRRCSLSLPFFFCCPGGCVLNRGKVLGGETILPWPAEQALCIWYTPGWKKTIGNFRWTWYLPRSPPRRTVLGKMPLNHRKVFF